MPGSRRDFIRLGAFGSGALILRGAFAQSAATLPPDLQKVYEAAVKVIPGLSPDLIAGAKQEGTLSLYRLTYGFEPIFEAFNKLFPFITISDFKAGGNALYQRYTAEARAGRYIADVVQSAEPSQVEEADSQGLVTHVDLSSEKTILSQYYKKGIYYPFGLSVLNIAYNSDLVTEDVANSVLQSWDGLVDPRWKGKTGVVRFGTGGAVTLPMYWVWTQKGQEFWDKLLGQQPLIFDGMAVAAERLSAGGYSVHMFSNDTNFFDFQKKGAPLRWRYPNPSLAFPNIQFVAKSPPHPNAARLWLEWTMSEEGQRLLMKEIGVYPVRTDVRDDRPFVKEAWYKPPSPFFPYTWAEVNKERPVLQQQWDRSMAGRRG